MVANLGSGTLAFIFSGLLIPCDRRQVAANFGGRSLAWPIHKEHAA